MKNLGRKTGEGIGNEMRAENSENKEDRGDIGEEERKEGGLIGMKEYKKKQDGGTEQRHREVGTTGRW